MNREFIHMTVAVLVITLLSVVNISTNEPLEPEPATVADSVLNVNEEVGEEEVTEEKTVVTNVDAETETKQETPELESFDEEGLEKEFGDVQSGIDLLDSPAY
jgi:hypothetical protein